jgi:outer membrane murein-binding lipoprotein Lpp
LSSGGQLEKGASLLALLLFAGHYIFKASCAPGRRRTHHKEFDTMQSASKGLLIIAALGSLGLWGCTQNKNDAQNMRIRELEARYSKLEEDYHAVAAANENFRKRLGQLEKQLTKKIEELQTLARERDDLRQQVTARTGERDALHSQMTQFSRELQNLAGRIQSAVNAAPKTVTVSMAN